MRDGLTPASLLWCSLSCNHCNEEDAAALAEMLKVNASLKTLR